MNLANRYKRLKVFISGYDNTARERRKMDYDTTCALVKIALERHGYAVTEEVSGGGLIELTAPEDFTTRDGRKTRILFSGHAYTGLELQVLDAEGYWEREPWCPSVDLEDRFASVATRVEDFLEDVRGLSNTARFVESLREDNTAELKSELQNNIDQATATFDFYAKAELDETVDRDAMLNWWSGYRAGLEQAREIMGMN